MPKLGKFIKLRREELNVSRWELFKRTEIAYSYLTSIENGKHVKPNPDILKKISTALNVPYATLLIEAEYIKPSDVEEINTMIKGLFSPAFDDEMVDIITSDEMMDILQRLCNLKESKRKHALEGLKRFMQGFV